jgi:hypothetical protein
VAPPADDREALAQFWTGIHDMTEERVASNPPDSPLEPRTTRLQINVRRVTMPWMGTHILYVEEFPFDRPFEARRRVLLSIEAPAHARGLAGTADHRGRARRDPWGERGEALLQSVNWNRESGIVYRYIGNRPIGNLSVI